MDGGSPARRFRESRLATFVASAVVLVLILIPGDEVPKIEIPGLDKLVHLLMFACWALALRFDWELFRRRPAFLVAAVALAGPLTEVMQLFAPGRSFDPADMAADLAGGILAALLGGKVVLFADRLLSGPGEPEEPANPTEPPEAR